MSKTDRNDNNATDYLKKNAKQKAPAAYMSLFNEIQRGKILSCQEDSGTENLNLNFTESKALSECLIALNLSDQ